ncbi:MAG: alcohol dehydrogenase catalytic domain-containing protein [Candidatus Rokubacteria bacterium]|nr:alcohol dehydrogenase catalytic domain-containing protein [Candidatus Rokubacteria bacterium]
MKAVAVIPGKPNSIHLREVPKPAPGQAPEGRGVLVKVLRVGVDGTDKEINAAEYGAPPPGDDYLILGHESFGRVEAVGRGVHAFKPGDYVVASVRRPGSIWSAGTSSVRSPPVTLTNQGFVLGNKVAFGSVNASREDFERGVQDLSHAELQYPGWLLKLLTHPVKGLENYAELMRTLTEGKGTIKVFCEVAPLT